MPSDQYREIKDSAIGVKEYEESIDIISRATELTGRWFGLHDLTLDEEDELTKLLNTNYLVRWQIVHFTQTNEAYKRLMTKHGLQESGDPFTRTQRLSNALDSAVQGAAGWAFDRIFPVPPTSSASARRADTRSKPETESDNQDPDQMSDQQTHESDQQTQAQIQIEHDRSTQ